MRTNFNPMVSIIIPVYNGSNYIREAIDSALSQTYKNIEVIVVNDGSDDNGKTEMLVMSYGHKIRYFYKENGGVSSALNIGIDNMRGEYFSWLSHDDKYKPDKISNQIESLENIEQRENTIAYCASMQIDKDSRPIKNIIRNNATLPRKLYLWDEALMMLLKQGTFNGCAFLIPKTAFEKCGKFDENLRYNQDAMMWYSIFLSNYSLIVSDNIGVMTRIHNNQFTQTGRDIFYKDCELMSKYLIPKFTTISSHYNFLYAYAKYNAKYNNQAIVRKCMNIGGKNSLVNKQQLLNLEIIMFYGKIRPWIRRLYYKIFKKVVTR